MRIMAVDSNVLLILFLTGFIGGTALGIAKWIKKK